MFWELAMKGICLWLGAWALKLDFPSLNSGFVTYEIYDLE